MSPRLQRVPVWAWAALLALPAVLDGLRGGFYVGNGTDLFSYQYPLRAWAAQTLQGGEFPAWNPHVLGGVPALAGWQLGLLYPLHLLSLAAPWRATEWLLWLHLAWLAMGWAVLARTWNPRLAVAAAVLVAAVVAFSGPTWGHIWAGHVSFVEAWAWWPWIWCGLLRWSQSRRHSALVLTAMALALQLLAGHPQMTFMTVTTAVVPLVLQRPSHAGLGSWRVRAGWALGGLVAAGCGAGLLAAVQLGPVWHVAEALNRSLSTPLEIATAYSAPAATLWTAVAPSAWGGTAAKLTALSYHETVAFVGPCAVALAALGAGRRTGASLAWLTALGVVLLVSLGDQGPLMPWLSQHVPGFGAFRVPGRWVTAGVALLALLVADALAAPAPLEAGQGQPTVRDRTTAKGGATARDRPAAHDRPAWLALALPVLLLLAAGWGLAELDSAGGWWQSHLRPAAEGPRLAARDHTAHALLGLGAAATVALAALLAPRWRGRCALLLGVAGLGHGMWFATGHLGSAARQPALALEAWSRDAAALRGTVGDNQRLATAAALREANAGGLAQVRVAGGYEPAVTADQNRFGNLMAGRAAAGYSVLFAVRAPGAALDRMAVSHLLADPSDAAAARQFAGWPVVQSLPSGRVLRANPHPRPRLEATPSWLAAGQAEAALALVQQPAVQRVVLSGQGLPAPPGGPPCPVQMIHDAPSRVAVRVACPAGGAVVLRDAAAPGWQVWVDGQRATAWVADAMFRAVIVPAGSHEVEWRYRPGTWPWTPWLSALAWAAGLTWLWRSRRAAWV